MWRIRKVLERNTIARKLVHRFPFLKTAAWTWARRVRSLQQRFRGFRPRVAVRVVRRGRRSFVRSLSARPDLCQRIESILSIDWYDNQHSGLWGFRVSSSTYLSKSLFWEHDPTPLFDSGWYRETYGIPLKRVCLIDYLERGHIEGREPSPYFNSEWYRSQVPELSISPLEHYITEGRLNLVSPHPLFDPHWYADQCVDFRDSHLYDLEHYVTVGSGAGKSPSPLFWPNLYRQSNPDAHRLGVEPLYHYLRWGHRQGAQGSPFVESAHYVSQYRDDSLLDKWDPVSHFTHCGVDEGMTPSSDPLANHMAPALVKRARRSRRFIRVMEPSGSPACDWKLRAAEVSLEMSERPRVSVIIPTLNRAHDVIRCTESIAASGDTSALEVVVVDDASNSEHRGLIASIKGITLISLTENHGFAGAVEAGVAASSGEFLMLLNNDTEVLPNWLDSLVGDFEAHPEVGIVGSMILQGDMTIQEVGAVVWSDGSAAHFGRGASPMERFARRRRPVDYLSGASLLIRRQLWEQIGGFDPQFAPAYYEDTDLCFAARREGYEVWVNPGSIVVHRESSSYGRNLIDGKRRQFINRPLFAEKWAEELRSALDPPNQYLLWDTLAYGDRRLTNNVLVLDYHPVDPSRDAGSVRMNEILRALVDRGNVVHFMSMNWQDRWKWEDEISRYGVNVLRYTADLDRFLDNHRDRLRFVLVSRPECYEIAEKSLERFVPEVPVIYDMVDAHGLRLERKARLTHSDSDFKSARRNRNLEKRYIEKADLTIAVSHEEEQYARELSGTDVETMTLGLVHRSVDIRDIEASRRSGIVFVGGFRHDPNIDAVRWFVHEILPIVVAERPEIRLTVIGAFPPPEILDLRGPHVDVLGWVEDLGPIYRQARVAIAPLRYGAGVKGKVGEALSHGVPVVTTSIGAEGFGISPEQGCLIADSTHAFADHVVRLLEDDSLWLKLSVSGHERINQVMGVAALHLSLDELDRQVRLIEDGAR
jgi:GT2 family glycosyltransferase